MSEILVADDSLIMQKTLRLILKKNKEQNLSIMSDLKQTLDLLEKKSFDLIILSQKLAGIKQVEDFVHIRNLAPQASLLIISDSGKAQLTEKLQKRGFHHFIAKPFTTQILWRKVQELGIEVPSDLLSEFEKEKLSQNNSIPTLLNSEQEAHLHELCEEIIEKYCKENFHKIAAKVIRQQIDELTHEQH